MIIAVMGLPGSGKSYFASRFAKKISANYFSSDIIRRQLLTYTHYTLDEKMRVYDIMIREMKTAISQKEDVVLDATFYKKEIREMFIQAAKGLDEDIIFIEIETDLVTTKERLNRRRKNSEADYPVYLKIKADFEPLEKPHLVLRSKSNNITQMITEAQSYLRSSYEA